MTIFLRQALGDRLPFVAASTTPINAQLAVVHVMLRVTLDWDNVNGVRLVCVDIDHESKIRGQVATDLGPLVARVITTHNIPMLLHEKHPRPFGIHRNVMYAVTYFSIRIGDVLRAQSAINWRPALAAVIGSKCTCC